MSYELITQYDSRNFTPAAQVPAVYGRARTIDSITIHWWGLPEWNATFEGTTDFLCTNTKPTSAHEVIEAGRVAVIVSHGDAAWAAGNATGNATSVHLELNPRASDGDYATAAERIRDIRAEHGKDLPLIPHRTWQATMCPGHYDLARLDSMSRDGTISLQSTSTPQEDDMAADTPFTSKDGSPVTLEQLLNSIDGKVEGVPALRAEFHALDVDLRGDLANKGQQLAALTAANGRLVELLAGRDGLDAQAIIDGVTAAIAERVKITATIDGGAK